MVSQIKTFVLNYESQFLVFVAHLFLVTFLHFTECELHIDILLYLFKVIADNLCLSSITASVILQPEVRPDRVIHVEDIGALYDLYILM